MTSSAPFFLLLAACYTSPGRPEFTHPEGFGDVCTTDADCIGDYHCSAVQGGRCTLFCTEGQDPCDAAIPGCGVCPDRCEHDSGPWDCDGLCEDMYESGQPKKWVAECIVSYGTAYDG